MKTISKYLFFVMAAALCLTSCEKKVERDPSPEAPVDAVAFQTSGASAELDKLNDPLQHEVVLVRTTNIDAAATVPIEIVSADPGFVIPSEAKFEAGQKTTSIIVTFAEAEDHKKLSFTIAIPEKLQHPYSTGTATHTYSVILTNWSAPQKGVLTDYSLPNLYGFPVFSFYVDYQFDALPDGSFNLRILKPFYIIADGTEEEDENGVYPYFIYNEPGDLMEEGNYNIDIAVDAEGVATVSDFSTGMSWTQGEISFINYRTTAQGTGKLNDNVKFDIATEQMAVCLAGKAYNYAGFSFYFNVDAFLNDQVQIEPVNAEVDSYTGNWKIKRTDFRTGEAADDVVVSVETAEDEDGQYYIIKGIHEDAPEIYGYFDTDIHTFVLGISKGVQFTKEDKTYQAYWYPLATSGKLQQTLILALQEDGTLAVHETSAAGGFAILYENVADENDYSFGDAFVIDSIEPTDEEPAISGEEPGGEEPGGEEPGGEEPSGEEPGGEEPGGEEPGGEEPGGEEPGGEEPGGEEPGGEEPGGEEPAQVRSILNNGANRTARIAVNAFRTIR